MVLALDLMTSIHLSQSFGLARITDETVTGVVSCWEFIFKASKINITMEILRL